VLFEKANKNKEAERADGPNTHAFGTSVTHPACADCAPEASGYQSSATLAKKHLPVKASRIIFGGCLLAFVGTFLALSILVDSGERFQAIGVSVVFLCLWGSMVYFAGTRVAFCRKFWFSCAAISLVSYILLFASTVFNEERSPVVCDSEQEIQIQGNSPKEEFLYQNPLLIYRLYSSIYAQIRDANNSFRTHPVFIGSAILSLTLPIAFIFSSYHCWKPIKKNV
jgi:hypothetical protein